MRNPERPKGDRYGDWLFLSDEWESELNELVKLGFDLDIGDHVITPNDESPALKREGIIVYRLGYPSPLRGGVGGNAASGI